MKACCNKPCNMSHVYHQVCSDFVCDLTEALEIDRASVCAGSCHDQLRTAFFCDLQHLIIIDHAIIVHAVRDHMEIFSGHIDRRTMRQMSAVIQIHAHVGISRFKHCEKYCHICLRARVRLDIGILTAEELFRALPRKILHNIHALASAVISLPRIPFCVFVRQRASHRSHDSLAHPVLRCDQLNV